MSDDAKDLDKPEELTPEQEAEQFESSFNEQADERDGVSNELEEESDLDKPEDLGAEKKSPEAIAAEALEKEKLDADKEFEGWPQVAIDRYKSQQEQNQKLSHQLSSDAGRVSGFQTKVNGLEKKIEALQAGGGDQPSKEDIAEAMLTDEGWEKFTEDYPVIASVIDKRFEVQQSQVDEKINTSLAPVLEKAEQDNVAAEEAATTEAYGEIAKVFPLWQNETSKQEYTDWVNVQSPGIQVLADSHSIDDAVALIGLYDDYRVSTGHQTMKVVPESNDGDKENVSELAEKRSQQLENGITLPSKSSRVDANAESGGEFENAFDAFAARKIAANSRK